MRKGGTRRVSLADGCTTTVHVAGFPLVRTRLRVVRLSPAAPLEEWCARHGVDNAVSGGYSVKPQQEPLGELWIAGRAVAHRPFKDPWRACRGALAASEGHIEIDARERLPTRPSGCLLQAGPLLVRDGSSAIAGKTDPEGFAATADEFDQDLTAEREPRLALARTSDSVLAVAADGRGRDDAGLTLWELADLLVDLGARSAMNLDGGSASVIIANGRRLNTPRTNDGEEMKTASPSVTAILLEPSG
jgi:Phosphodiester glycosidase